VAGSGRNPANALIAAALAAGEKVADVAVRLGVSESTIYRRLRDAEFAEEVNRLRAEMVSRGLGILSETNADAALTLRDLLKSGSEKIKLTAAKAILELTLKVKDVTEFAERLEAIEEFNAMLAAERAGKKT
jgi:AcrR family transcriptional regulator